MSLKVLKSVKALMKKITGQKDQSGYYKSQVGAFTKLKSLNEFAYVISYRELEADKSINMLANKECANIPYRQANYNCAIWFLNFLDNITSEEVI